MKVFLMFVQLLLAVACCRAQSDTTTIHVTGRVEDPLTRNPDLTNFMVVDMGTQRGIYGKADGSFAIDMGRNDTLVVAVIGYEFMKYSFRDSAVKDTYDILVKLKRKEIKLPEVRVLAPRDLEAIERDIQNLGYNKKDYEISGINAVESPITFLYEEFSRREQLRRHNALVMNDDKRRKLLKELLSRYVADDIIALSNDQFDRFIDFCDVSEQFLKKSTQYEFMVFIKHRYELFETMNDYYRPERKMR